VTTFLLIRHATTDAVGRVLAGRQPGHGLNGVGREQVAQLCRHLEQSPIDRVFSSPLERARQTAAPLAQKLHVPLQIAEPLNELDYGDWTGRSFEELALDPRWTAYNTNRSLTRIPGGELMLEAQTRAIALLLELREQFPGETIALVTHCDIIRAMLLFQLGISLDRFTSLEIRPASVSTLQLHETGSVLLSMNVEAACNPASSPRGIADQL
jgi:probable phosphoglycerate mutase